MSNPSGKLSDQDVERLTKLLEENRRILQTLEMQAAAYTTLTMPAHLVFELDDIRKVVAKLEAMLFEAEVPYPANQRDSIESLQNRLETAKRVLRRLELDAAGYSTLTMPANLRLELLDKKEEVDRLTGALDSARQLYPIPSTHDSLVSIISAASEDKERALDLSGRAIISLPPLLFDLTHLESLDLSRNALVTLSPAIGRLRNLRHLNLSGNRLSSLPVEICQLHLSTLLIHDNPLAIPKELSTLLSRPVGLDPSTLQKLRKALSRTDAFRNERFLEASFADSRLSPLRDQLPLASNSSEQVSLMIDYLLNQRSTTGENALVLFLQVLTKLTDPQDALRLDLLDSAEQVQQEVSSRQRVTPSTLFTYLFPSTRRTLNEAKILLVGEGGVGKTSLVKRLLGQTFDSDEEMTKGISVEPWYVTIGDEPFRLNIWDFGGQEIMHATHQFFLTRRSLYLVVIDARTDERGLDYWLQVVRSYGGDSSPIIVVVNKDEIQHIELNEVALRTKYPNICAFVFTSCINETHSGIAQLRQVILDQVAHMEHIRTSWPTPWAEVKTRLEQMERDFIAYDEYLAMCAKEDIDSEDSRTLASFLHDLGIVLNYHDDPRLQETNILNPEWVTRAVYSIINARAIVESKGILELAQLSDILEDHRCYPPHKHGFILNLMCKFELGFPLDQDHKRYLIPDLLPKSEVLLEGWPPKSETFFFQFRYSVLPGSIITRLIVQMHHYIYNGIVWRTGACLRYQDNFALIKADQASESLTIAIIGNTHTRREILAILRERLRDIHASFKDLAISEYVAIPSHPDLYEDYNHLLNLERLGERNFVPRGLAQRISIAAVLDSIVTPEERGAIFGISDALLNNLQRALVATGLCDSFLTLFHRLEDSPVVLWRNSLQEAATPQDQAYEIIRNFHNRMTASGENGLDLFLQWVIHQIPEDQRLRTDLSDLNRQFVLERAAYYATPTAASPTTITYNITVKEGSQIAAIGDHSTIGGGAHFYK